MSVVTGLVGTGVNKDICIQLSGYVGTVKPFSVRSDCDCQPQVLDQEEKPKKGKKGKWLKDWE